MVQVLEEPRWVYPAEALHGLTFAAMWAATRYYAQEIAPGPSLSSIPSRLVLPSVSQS